MFVFISSYTDCSRLKKFSEVSETLHITSEGFRDMFEGSLKETCQKSVDESVACAETRERDTHRLKWNFLYVSDGIKTKYVCVLIVLSLIWLLCTALVLIGLESLQEAK